MGGYSACEDCKVERELAAAVSQREAAHQMVREACEKSHLDISGLTFAGHIEALKTAGDRHKNMLCNVEMKLAAANERVAFVEHERDRWKKGSLDNRICIDNLECIVNDQAAKIVELESALRPFALAPMLRQEPTMEQCRKAAEAIAKGEQ